MALAQAATATARAGGEVAELLAVYFAWVKFDLVTARFARPWMWREPSVAPLYATGSEFQWHEKAREQYSKAQEKLSKTQEKLKEILQSGDTEKANALMEDCVKTKKKLEEMIKTMPPEEVPIPLLLIVIIMNFIITSSSSDLAAHLHQDLAEGEPQQD